VNDKNKLKQKNLCNTPGSQEYKLCTAKQIYTKIHFLKLHDDLILLEIATFS